MAERDLLTDNEAHELLNRAMSMFSGQHAKTIYTETALRAAEKALLLYQLGVLGAALKAEDAGKS